MAHKSFPCPKGPQTEVKQTFQKNKVLTWRTAVILEKVYAEMMNAWVEKLRLQYCDGCKFNNPSQRRHACLMNSQEEAWNEFYDEAQQRIDPKEIIAITSQIMDCPLTDSWMKYVEALRKLSWWNHYATFQEMYRSLSQDERLICEKVWQAVENHNKNPFAPLQSQSVRGEPMECPFVDNNSPQPMQIDDSTATLTQEEAMDVDEQLSTDFANKLVIQ